MYQNIIATVSVIVMVAGFGVFVYYTNRIRKSQQRQAEAFERMKRTYF